MKYYKQLGIVISALLWLVTPLRAEQVSGLYEAEVPVESQARDVRETALQLALQQVLVRVTGRRNVLDMAENMRTELEKAPRYVQQFRYQTRTAGVGGKSSEVLWVRFDSRAIERLLQQHRLPVWGHTRPATLIWLVVDDRRERELLSNDMDTRARQIIEQQGRLRGLPLRFPLMDLTDRTAISVSDVWGNFEDNLLAASARYDAEAVLSGRVAKTTSGGWTARWSLYQDGRSQTWNASGRQLEEAIVPAINQLADVLAEQFARIGQNDQSEKLRVRINEVRGLADFNRVMNYLKNLALVEAVSVEQIEGDTLNLVLTSRHGRVAINQAVSLGHTLKAETLSMARSELSSGISVTAEPVGEQGVTRQQARPIDLQYRLLP